MRQREHQSGFSIVEAVLIVAAMGIIGAAGWFVYQHNRPKATNAAANSTQSTSQQTQQTTTTSPAPTVSYLTIKEWGIKLPLSDTIKDAYYVVLPDTSLNADGKPSDIQFGLTSLNSSCGTILSNSTGFDHSLGAIVRTLPTDTDPVSGKLYTQLEPNGTTIDGYYYGWANANLKAKSCISATTIQSIDSAFANAAKATVSATAN